MVVWPVSVTSCPARSSIPGSWCGWPGRAGRFERLSSVGVRLEMLEEAIELIRLLHRGEQVSFHEHHEVQDARIYTLPDEQVPIYVSGFGPQATKLAARIGDGYCTAVPDPDLVRVFRESGGGKRPVQGGLKVCWDETEEAGLDTAHPLWANELLPGQLVGPERGRRTSRPRPAWSPGTPWGGSSPAARIPSDTSPPCSPTSTPGLTRCHSSKPPAAALRLRLLQAVRTLRRSAARGCPGRYSSLRPPGPGGRTPAAPARGWRPTRCPGLG